jgi:hypothetical protein
MLNQADLETLVALKRLCRRRLPRVPLSAGMLHQANRDDEGTPLTHVAIRPDVLLRILAHVDSQRPDEALLETDVAEHIQHGLPPVLLVL